MAEPLAAAAAAPAPAAKPAAKGAAAMARVEEKKADAGGPRVIKTKKMIKLFYEFISKVQELADNTIKAWSFLAVDIIAMFCFMQALANGWVYTKIVATLEAANKQNAGDVENEAWENMVTTVNPEAAATGVRDLAEDISDMASFVASRGPVFFSDNQFNRGFDDVQIAKLGFYARFYHMKLNTKRAKGEKAVRTAISAHTPTFARIGIMMAPAIARGKKTANVKPSVSISYPPVYDAGSKSFKPREFYHFLQFSSVFTIIPEKYKLTFLSAVEWNVAQDAIINKGRETPRDTIEGIARTSMEKSHISEEDRVALMEELGVDPTQLFIPSSVQAVINWEQTDAFMSFVTNSNNFENKPMSYLKANLGDQLLNFILGTGLLNLDQSAKGIAKFDAGVLEGSKERATKYLGDVKAERDRLKAKTEAAAAAAGV